MTKTTQSRNGTPAGNGSGRTRRVEPSFAAAEAVSAPWSTTREGRQRFGHLVTVRRDRIGLTRAALAAQVGISQAEIARIEAGRPPSDEVLDRLLDALYAEPGTRPPEWSIPAGEPGLGTRLQSLGGGFFGERPPAWSSLSRRLPAWSSLSRRWLWGALGLVALILLVLVMAGGSSDEAGDASPDSQPAAAISPVAVLPSAADAAHRQERKARRARIAEKKAAAAAAAAARRKEAKASAAASPDPVEAETESESASAPIAPAPPPPPAPSGGGGGGGGGSGGAPPGIGHGISGG